MRETGMRIVRAPLRMADGGDVRVTHWRVSEADAQDVEALAF
jgi:hypothetical protein